VIRNSAFRFVAAVVGLASGLATPTSALAHAIDHGRTGTNAHHGVPGNGYAHAHHGPSEPDRSAEPHERGDHPHALLDAALTARVDCDLGPVLSVGIVLFEEAPAVVAGQPASRVMAAPIHRALGPPPPSRAPPLS
jgi:hypothetical protein